jgi:hypothetical protein
MTGIFWLAAGTVVFVLITFFEQLPVLGWLGGIVSVGAWVALTRALMSDRERDPARAGIGLLWAGAIGAVTGFVGALTAWLAQTGNLFGFETAPGARFGAAFGFVGALLGLVYWPLVGAVVCLVTALVVTGRTVR